MQAWIICWYVSGRTLANNTDAGKTELGTEEFQRISTPLVSGLKVLYWPQVGFLTAISRSGVLPLEEYASLSEYGLRYQFHTTEFVYFKSDRMDEMDDAVGGT